MDADSTSDVPGPSSVESDPPATPVAEASQPGPHTATNTAEDTTHHSFASAETLLDSENGTPVRNCSSPRPFHTVNTATAVLSHFVEHLSPSSSVYSSQDEGSVGDPREEITPEAGALGVVFAAVGDYFGIQPPIEEGLPEEQHPEEELPEERHSEGDSLEEEHSEEEFLEGEHPDGELPPAAQPGRRISRWSWRNLDARRAAQLRRRAARYQQGAEGRHVRRLEEGGRRYVEQLTRLEEVRAKRQAAREQPVEDPFHLVGEFLQNAEERLEHAAFLAFVRSQVPAWWEDPAAATRRNVRGWRRDYRGWTRRIFGRSRPSRPRPDNPHTSGSHTNGSHPNHPRPGSPYPSRAHPNSQFYLPYPTRPNF
ncbi:hypothetical protein GGR55DRAFT_677638 [Xylaria sp. FL0064]|nr:hypothetical protein GGR55DRAFT_677638 [Xylaria sp. FL0064]